MPQFNHTNTPPALADPPALSAFAYYVAYDLDYFMIWSYAPSRFFISVLTATKVS